MNKTLAFVITVFVITAIIGISYLFIGEEPLSRTEAVCVDKDCNYIQDAIIYRNGSSVLIGEPILNTRNVTKK